MHYEFIRVDPKVEENKPFTDMANKFSSFKIFWILPKSLRQFVPDKGQICD